MKITFIFRDTHYERRSFFEFSPDAKEVDYRKRILELADRIASFTQGILHVSCSEAGIDDTPIKLTNELIFEHFTELILLFRRRGSARYESEKLMICYPVNTHIGYGLPGTRGKGPKTLDHFLVHPSYMTTHTQVGRDFRVKLLQLSDECLSLLNSHSPVGEETAWKFAGFHPRWPNHAAARKAEKEGHKRGVEARKLARQEQRRKEREALPTTTSDQDTIRPEPVTGAGRRPGAIPGVFKGVQMRSQLEIRFAAQLEERAIRWIYEGERLGETQYMVDFYLPDQKIWVEVKGKFEARDNFQLPLVAKFLSQERGEKLYVYAQSKAYHFSASGTVSTLTHDQFWNRITR